MNFKHLLALLTLSLSIPAGAMDMIRSGDTMIMMGKVVREDLATFNKQLEQGPLRRVILGNNPGGDLQAAFGIADLLTRHGINTAASGRCLSACAVIFMGGIERQMVEGDPKGHTRIGFHGPHKAGTRKLSEEGSKKTFDFLMQASGNKLDRALLERAMYIATAGDMLYFFYPREDRKANVWFCDEGVGVDLKMCEAVPGADPVAMGVLTTLELLSLQTKINTAPAQP